MTRIETHKDLCEELHDLYRKKNADYGDSFRITRERFPEAILIRLWDKMNRLTNLMKGNSYYAVDEPIEDTLIDLANYALLELVERKQDALEGSTDSGL